MSASPPIATRLRTSREVGFVPNPEVAALFDHFVGAQQDGSRQLDADCLGGL